MMKELARRRSNIEPIVGRGGIPQGQMVFPRRSSPKKKQDLVTYYYHNRKECLVREGRLFLTIMVVPITAISLDFSNGSCVP